MPLIIVESPAKAKTISKILGKKYEVKASVGHIRELSDDKKNSKGEKFEIAGVDINNHFEPIFSITKNKEKVVKELKDLAKKHKNEILFATDSDREGESISWHLAKVLNIKDFSNLKRLEFHEITKTAIEHALENPRNINLDLVSAQRARQVLDRMVGFKISPVLWQVMGNYKLSAGRVQSPALALICDREEEIEAFTPQEYWEIEGAFVDENKAPVKQTWVLVEDLEIEGQKFFSNDYKKDDSRVWLRFTKSKGEKIPKIVENHKSCQELTISALKNNSFTVISVKTKEEKSYSRPPFITSTLQQAASSALGYAPKATMQIAQKLYEGIDIDGVPTALITYMRTDSVNLSKESVELAREFISEKYKAFLPPSPKFYKSKSRNAQEAHEAIRPINPKLTPEQLKGKVEPKMLKLYELIWKQMIASQMTDEVRTRLTFEIQNHLKDEFQGSTAWTIHAGFKALTGEKLVTENKYNIKEGEKLLLEEIEYTQNFTKPPSRFSPASLIKKMEELGIGRPSTYATIISTLLDRAYVENAMGSASLMPTTLGRKIYQLLKDNFTNLTSSELTAKMEETLDQISRGEEEYENMMNNFWWPFKKEVDNKNEYLAQVKDKYKSSKSNEKCPICAHQMELKLGRFGEYFQCVNVHEHQFQKNYKEYEEAVKKYEKQYASQAEGKKCLDCGKDLIVRVSKSSLNPYIACPDYRVGSKHTVVAVNFGPCPKCASEGRSGDEQGVLVKKKGFRGKSFIGCSLDKKVCGYVQKETPGKENISA